MPFEKAFLTSPLKTLEQSVEPLSIFFGKFFCCDASAGES